MSGELALWLSNAFLLVTIPTLFAIHGRLSNIEGQIEYIKQGGKYDTKR